VRAYVCGYVCVRARARVCVCKEERQVDELYDKNLC